MRSDDDISLLPPCEVLREVVGRAKVVLPDGTEKRLTANISAVHSNALYKTVLREKPKLVIEVGMAQGISTLSILSALAQSGGKLISIDPYTDWKSARDAALHNIKRAGFSDSHQLLEDFSFKVLPRLLEEGVQPEFAYVDGAHDFSNVFIDAFYLDKMLDPGGVIAFNDVGRPDVYRVIKFIEQRRRYRQLDVGLSKDFRGRSLLHTCVRFFLRRSREDRYLRKPTNETATLKQSRP